MSSMVVGGKYNSISFYITEFWMVIYDEIIALCYIFVCHFATVCCKACWFHSCMLHGPRDTHSHLFIKPQQAARVYLTRRGGNYAITDGFPECPEEGCGALGLLVGFPDPDLEGPASTGLRSGDTAESYFKSQRDQAAPSLRQIRLVPDGKVAVGL